MKEIQFTHKRERLGKIILLFSERGLKNSLQAIIRKENSFPSGVGNEINRERSRNRKGVERIDKREYESGVSWVHGGA